MSTSINTPMTVTELEKMIALRPSAISFSSAQALDTEIQHLTVLRRKAVLLPGSTSDAHFARKDLLDTIDMRIRRCRVERMQFAQRIAA